MSLAVARFSDTSSFDIALYNLLVCFAQQQTSTPAPFLVLVL